MSASAAVLLLLVLAGRMPPGALAGAPPAALAGTWDVVRVAVDSQDAQHWGYRPDDPRLLNRTLTISADRVQLAHGKRIGCSQKTWTARRSTWAILFGKGFPRPEMGGRSASPSPSDFGLKVSPKQEVNVYSLCGHPGVRFPADNWVAARDDQLALHYDNQVLLLLHRRASDEKPTASFDCSRTVTPTEKAICVDFDLAGLDRSVAQAFREAVQRSPEKEAHLRQSQQEWVKERDGCGARADCLYDEQWSRIDELTQE